MSASLSRFAVLRIENDEDERAAQRARDKQKAAAQKLLESKKKVSKAQTNTEKNEAKKSKAAQERAELKALAFGTSKPKKSSAPKKKPAVVAEKPPAEWNEWKQRDQQFVEGCFEAQLKEALIASKIDFEAQKGTSKTEKPLEKEVPKKMKSGNNKKGSTTMSLDQFKQGPQVKESAAVTSQNGVNGTHVDDDHFFDEVADEAKRIASKEKIKTEVAKKNIKKQNELKDSQPRVAQLQEELNEKNVEIESLTSENEKLRQELLNVKTRNKRLCSILVQGEMKEKAELIVEMEKISKVKDELTAELENLSSQLQQERSKVTALTDSKKAAARK